MLVPVRHTLVAELNKKSHPFERLFLWDTNEGLEQTFVAVDAIQVFKGQLKPFYHRLFAFP